MSLYAAVCYASRVYVCRTSGWLPSLGELSRAKGTPQRLVHFVGVQTELLLLRADGSTRKIKILLNTADRSMPAPVVPVTIITGECQLGVTYIFGGDWLLLL